MLKPEKSISEDFHQRKNQLFEQQLNQSESFNLSLGYSLLVEEFIRKIAGSKSYKFVLTSSGSFSRRELSPFSDIDLIFIAVSVEENEKDIANLIKTFWDSGIEVSHTIRDFSDIEKYLQTDLHTFTQFFETRYLLGSNQIYKKWNTLLLNSLTDEVKVNLLKALFEDFNLRCDKYGDSPKVLEPNVKLSAGGLRDFQAVEWMYIFRKSEFLNKQNETTQAEEFINTVLIDKITSKEESKRLLNAYNLILTIRNLLHLISNHKTDWFEFKSQIKVAKLFGYNEVDLTKFMRRYFEASNALNRFSKSMIKKYNDEMLKPIPSSLAIILDDDFKLTGKVISHYSKNDLSFSDILRAFYYRGHHSARFDENLRLNIIEKFANVDHLDLGEISIDIAGHEIIGAEMASSIMHRMGYSEEEIDTVSFLVRNHLLMEQIAFRRNLNDPETLNNFTSKFNNIERLNLLYLLTYADLSAVNPAIWTNWKNDLLEELYQKSYAMLKSQITGEELLISSTSVIPQDISQHSNSITDSHAREHIESINDFGYVSQFSVEEIAYHIEEIRKGINLSVIFKNLEGFTNITIITKDFPSLLSKICGVLTVNDVNIHDAKIFTRKDGIVIDTFNVTEFNSHQKIPDSKYQKIETDLKKVVVGLLQLNKELASMKSKWWRIENKLFKRSGNVKIILEKHEKYSIIDVHSPDRLGFLFQVTSKMNELGLNIYFAKISTKGDDIVDSFYVLDRNKKKISPNDQEFVISELKEAISQIL
ncbi:MAG: [protein-PII] uridylyltransferase [Ignavibacteriaceae bacterium]